MPLEILESCKGKQNSFGSDLGTHSYELHSFICVLICEPNKANHNIMHISTFCIILESIDKIMLPNWH
jgi:hypothetical protein